MSIPDGFVLARTTDVFDNDTAPPGLLKAHRVADTAWARFAVEFYRRPAAIEGGLESTGLV